MSAPIEPKEYRVDPSRLASGTWCHTRNRQIGEGDIAASYSADKIGLEGKVRRPFVWQNSLWVCTSLHSMASELTAESYRLLPERFFDGKPISYHENVMLGDEARLRPEGFYHGMTVQHSKKGYVLIGPCANFLPQEDSDFPKQTNLLDLL